MNIEQLKTALLARGFKKDPDDLDPIVNGYGLRNTDIDTFVDLVRLEGDKYKIHVESYGDCDLSLAQTSESGESERDFIDRYLSTRVCGFATIETLLGLRV